MIAGLSWAAWGLLVIAAGTGFAIQLWFFVTYRRAVGGDPDAERPTEAGRATET